MKSVLIFVSSFLLVAAVHGSALLEIRDDVKDQGNGTHTPQSGSGIFSIYSNCDALRKLHSCVFKMHVLSV